MHRKPIKTYGRKLVASRPIPTIELTNYLHELFDSSDSDNCHTEKHKKDESITNNPFESTFDRVARTAKLPPIPSDQNVDNSILYVSSSSLSSLSDERWIRDIKKSREIPPKKIVGKKRKKTIDLGRKKNNEKINVKKKQVTNRKRQNNLPSINNDDLKNVESSQPQRKTRRAMKKKYTTQDINSSSDEFEEKPNSIITSPLTTELKSCCVKLTRIKITNPHNHQYEINEKSPPSTIGNENTIDYKGLPTNNQISAVPSANQQTDKFLNIKDCQVVLSRLDINSDVPCTISTTPNSKMLVSSTPFVPRILPSNFKTSFSPIDNQRNCMENEFSTIVIDEMSKINATHDDAKKPNLKNIVNNESYINELSYIESGQVHSHSDIKLLKNAKTKISFNIVEKSTQLLFETDDDISDINSNKDILKSDSCKESIMPSKLIETNRHSLSLSLEDNETHLTPENISKNKIHENTFDFDHSSLCPSNVNDQSENNNKIFEKNHIESNTSIISQTMDSKNTKNFSDTSISLNVSNEESNNDTSEDSYHLVISNESSSNHSPEKNSVKVIDDDEDIDLDDSNLNVTKMNDKINMLNKNEPFVLVSRLSDPVKITKTRDKYINWDRHLDRISESFEKHTSMDEFHQENYSPSKNAIIREKNKITELSESENHNPSRISRRRSFYVENKNIEATHNKILYNDELKKVFLAPGKSWARSLSILNHINNNDDMEIMSRGKGKKWRQSVKNIFDMQSQGILNSCINNYENENKNENNVCTVSHRIPRSNITRNSSSTLAGAVESTSPGRFVRRVSIRVVPDEKYSIFKDRDVKDTSFLEVYGISTSEKRKTLGKKSLSIAPTDTFVYNLRHSDVDVTNVLQEPIVAAKNVVLQRCNQTNSIPFEECYPETFLNRCHKIGEGVYGEVFLYENKKEKSVIKIIPIEGNKLVNGEPQKKFCEILSEIIIAKELHNLRFHKIYRTCGFIEVKNIRCLIGRYPQRLIEHWQAYDDEKTSDNDCPSMFTDDQLYIALELGHGGHDLEAFIFQNATEAYTSFVQTALTLAVAEKSLDFEHRDLHWGNILISRTDDTEMLYKLDTEEIVFPCKGIKVAIIDFTLSRMSYQGCCIFNDLSLDPALFTAAGEYQFEIYRLMRAKVGNNWQLFEPYTNILWLHYTLDKMITSVRYKKKTTKIHKNAILKLQELKKILLNYDSAYDFVMNCDKLSNLQRRSASSQ